jgi:RNA polymerase sigma-70 factor (ECF subfamily)
MIAVLPEARELDDIGRAQGGDGEAYRRIVERYQARVGQIMWRFSREKRVHEELVQDVFVEAYFSLGSFRNKAPFENWLAAIATRVGYGYWKKTAAARKASPLSTAEWDTIAGADQVSGDADEAGEIVRRLFEQLGVRDRLVLTLRFLEGCDVAETARRTGWTRTMVKVQTLRARRKLQKLYECRQETMR